MINVDKISKEFIKNIGKDSHKFFAVKDISFNIKDGTIYGVLGSNGAGKTTLLRMISGIMTPTNGSIIIDDQTYKKNIDEIKNNIAFLSGNTKLYENITPKELLEIFGNIYGISKEVLNKRIEEVINILDMSEFKNNRIRNLSTGQIQRTNIARCFIHDPKYYILDEATAGLDVISSQIILDFIKKEKKRGKTIIYSTHYMEEAENICDKVLFIRHGEKVIEDTPKRIITKTKTTNLRDAFFALAGGKYEK